MGLPPKIELALGYLGGTEATRIREYIAELQETLAEANACAQELAEGWSPGELCCSLLDLQAKVSRLTDPASIPR